MGNDRELWKTFIALAALQISSSDTWCTLLLTDGLREPVVLHGVCRVCVGHGVVQQGKYPASMAEMAHMRGVGGVYPK